MGYNGHSSFFYQLLFFLKVRNPVGSLGIIKVCCTQNVFRLLLAILLPLPYTRSGNIPAFFLFLFVRKRGNLVSWGITKLKVFSVQRMVVIQSALGVTIMFAAISKDDIILFYVCFNQLTSNRWQWKNFQINSNDLYCVKKDKSANPALELKAIKICTILKLRFLYSFWRAFSFLLMILASILVDAINNG